MECRAKIVLGNMHSFFSAVLKEDIVKYESSRIMSQHMVTGQRGSIHKPETDSPTHSRDYGRQGMPQTMHV